MKHFLKYFIWTAIIGFILFIGFRLHLNLEEEAKVNYNIVPMTIFGVVFPIFIGMLLRLPLLIKEIKEMKRWTINWAKITAIGIPTLYITLSPLLYFTSFGHKLPFTLEMVQLNSNATTVAGLIFGYVLLDSIKK
jgi:uncharacterized membrane protein